MKASSSEPTSCSDLVTSLRHGTAYPASPSLPVTLHETHVSWVFLVGEWAYKIKKPITTPFLDYGTLSRRRHFCHEEVRLDSRYASDLYIGVVPITFDEGRFQVEGPGEPVEFAVKMKRFPEDALLSKRLEAGRLSTSEVLQLAHTVARFHHDAVRAERQSVWGSPDSVLQSALDNIRELQTGPAVQDFDLTLQSLDQWTTTFFDKHRQMFGQRLANGFIRECHGDLHLANVVQWNGRLTPFDGIEFNDQFRWIDVMSDAAFLAMDFAARGRPDLGRSFINLYLDQTGDHASLPVLRWYLVYRAMVRAKVAALIVDQTPCDAPDFSRAVQDLRDHLELALRFTQKTNPVLWITHGVSGSGKTTGSELVVQRCGAIRLRSDIERKRHFGLPPTDRPDESSHCSIYCESANHATYGRLRRLAMGILRAGFSVVIDATFLRKAERDLCCELAQREGVGFSILDFHTDEPTLRQRIADRMARDTDPSDANFDVLESQLASLEPLTASEMQSVELIPEAADETCASTDSMANSEHGV